MTPAATLEASSNTFRAKLFFALLVFFTLLKLLLAARLDLYSDEIFYWLESTRPALAYSDLPFVTATLAGLFSAHFDAATVAVRLPFITLGAAIPLLLVWIARPIVGTMQAWEAGILCHCLPLAAFLGLLAVPDVPLVFLGLLAFGLFERALRLQYWHWWVLAGAATALGFSTHYRFALYPLAVILFVSCSPQWRYLWFCPRFWTMCFVSSVGLLPILWFNFSFEAGAASFYLLERHPWSFQAEGLLHLFKQAGLVTPPLYCLLAYTLWHMLRSHQQQCRSAKRQQDTAEKLAKYPSPVGLWLFLALTNVLVYLVLAPWTDNTSTSIHWPLSGYYPILIFLPATLRQVRDLLRGRYPKRLYLVAPALGLCGSLVAFIGIGSQGFQSQLQPFLGTGVLSNKMAGWKEFGKHSEALIAEHFPQSPIILTDNYYTLAQTQFANLAQHTYSLDTDKAVRDGRFRQLIIWELDQQSLVAQSGRPALYISEDSALTEAERIAYLRRACRSLDSVSYLGELTLFNGDKKFSYYHSPSIKPATALTAVTVNNPSKIASSPQPCPYPAQAWIDSPSDQGQIGPTTSLSGWVLNEDVGINSVSLLVNELEVSQIPLDVDRPDVIAARQVFSDPAGTRVGFDLKMATHWFREGENTLALRIISNSGETSIFGRRSVHFSADL